jgi:hypothetical protein
LNVLGLCSGVGGLELGLRIAVPGARGVAYVEREAHAIANLVARMEGGELHHAPVWSDLATFDARPWRGVVDCVASGDPCQPNSVAGKRQGEADDRFLLDQVIRIIAECRPQRVFRENVPTRRPGSSGCSSRHWKDWATALRQEFSVRPKWGPAIAESDCSSWPTVRTSDVNSGRTLDEKGRRVSNGRLFGANLADVSEQWRTPSDIAKRGGSQAPEKRQAGGHTVNLEDQSEHWATPRAEDSEGAGMRHGRGVADTLTAQTSSWATPVANQHKGSSPGSVTRADGKSRMDILHYQAEQGFPFSLPAPPIPAGATSSRNLLRLYLRIRRTPAGPLRSEMRAMLRMAIRRRACRDGWTRQTQRPRYVRPSFKPSLNPSFVENLMGWPIGWTDCAQPETGLSRWLLHSRGVLSTLVSPPPSAVDQGSLF